MIKAQIKTRSYYPDLYVYDTNRESKNSWNQILAEYL